MINNDTAAFPGIDSSSSARRGMTLRDYFAAKAMSELVKSKGSQTWKCKARKAYIIADAMLEARSND